MKKIKAFNDAIFDHYPELKGVLKPNDHYPELEHILKFTPGSLPTGSMNTKVIINNGEVIERVYKTPKGEVISLFSKLSNRFCDQVA